MFSAALALTLMMVFYTSTALANARRVALVIGNSKYQHAPFLPNPVNDTDLCRGA